MVARNLILQRQYDALAEIRTVVDRHAPEVGERLRVMVPGGAIPTSGNFPDETLTFLAESVAVLAKRLDELTEERKPRPRGRPKQEEK